MTEGKFSRDLTMQCPTCGGKEFKFIGEADPVSCVSCGRSFTREELVRENGRRVDDEAEALAQEVLLDAKDKIRKALAGSKGFKFK